MGNYIIVGAFGSGKTEISLCLAGRLAEKNQNPVTLVDLDIMKPFFRSREAVQGLKNQRITIIASSLDFNADVPALAAGIYGAIQRGGETVFDVGGDDTGARVLGRFSAQLAEAGYRMWMAVNPYRPGSNNAEEMMLLAENIQKKSRLSLHGLIANPNLGRETTLAEWQRGRQIVMRYAELMGLPLLFSAVGPGLAEAIRSSDYPEEILYLDLKIRPPWEVPDDAQDKS